MRLSSVFRAAVVPWTFTFTLFAMCLPLTPFPDLLPSSPHSSSQFPLRILFFSKLLTVLLSKYRFYSRVKWSPKNFTSEGMRSERKPF